MESSRRSPNHCPARLDPRGRIVPLVGSALCVILSACSETPEAAPARAQAAGAAPVARVAMVKPVRQSIRRLSVEPGQVEPFETTPIHARIAGYVKAVKVDIGDRVTGGQLLAEIDAPEAQANLLEKKALAAQAEADRKQAVAAVEVARAGLVSAEAKADEARAGLRRLDADIARWQAESARTEQLARDAAVTTSLRDETRSRLEAARGALDEGKAQARSAEAHQGEARAHVDKAEADLAAAAARVDVARAAVTREEALVSFTRVVAPFEGVITRRNVDTGHLTTAGTAAQPLFVVSRADRVTVVVSVPEADASLVGPGDSARVRLPALDGRVVDGTITRTAFVLDDATRTLRAEIDLPNSEGHLRPGVYAQVEVVADQRTDALTVPATAIARDAGKTFCVVATGGRASRKEVRLGLGDGTKFEVLDGLSADDAVVAANADALTEGQPIEPLPPPPATKS